MKFVYLGKEQLPTQYNNVYHYIFNEERIDRPDVLMESDYLTPQQIQCSFRHLAEFGAFYVLWKHNPLK